MQIESKWLKKGRKVRLPCRVDILVDSGFATIRTIVVTPGGEQLMPERIANVHDGDKLSLGPFFADYQMPDTVSAPTNPNGKMKVGEFANVLLTADEFMKLQNRFGTLKAADLIERLSAYIASSKKGRKYVSHYATLLNWERRDKEKAESGKSRNPRTLPQTYTQGPDYQD